MDINTQNKTADYNAGALAKQGADSAQAKEPATDVSKGIQGTANNLPEALRKDLAVLLQNPNLSPKASTDAANDPGVAAKFAQIEQLLNSSNNSDAARLLGRLMVEIGAQQRQEALADRLNTRNAAKAELEAAAGKLEASADATRKGALMNMVFSMVAGAISIGFAAGTAKMTGAGLKGVEGDKQLIAAQAQAVSGGGQGLSGLSSAAGAGAGGMMEANAKTLQADQQRISAEAEVTKGEGEMEASEQQALQEFVNQIIQFIKELRDAEVEQLAVVTRG